MKTKILLGIVFAFGLALLFAAPARADSCTWQGGNGNWSDPAHWSCGHVPTISDTVTINGNNVTLTDNVTVADFVFTGGALYGSYGITVTNVMTWTGGGFTSGALTIASGAAMNINRPGGLSLGSSTVNNAGTILWHAGGLTCSGCTINNQARALFEMRAD